MSVHDGLETSGRRCAPGDLDEGAVARARP